MSGCLRLSTQENDTPSGTTTETRPRTGTDARTGTGTPASAEELPLSEARVREYLWEPFVRGGRIAGERVSTGGGSVIFVDRSGAVEYRSEDIGEWCVLTPDREQNLATNGTTVVALEEVVCIGGLATSSQVTRGFEVGGW